jgi:chemotaxis protein CheD
MVALADLAVSKDPMATLCSFPLGACIGVAIYDAEAKAGGILHSLLPDSSIDPVRAATRPGMFLDTGLAALVTQLTALGAKPKNLRVFAAGGALIMDDSGYFNIGKRNSDALAQVLAKMELKLEADDLGGRTNRSLRLNLADGEVRLKFSGQAKLRTLCKP